MNDEELFELERLAKEATPGPWWVGDIDDGFAAINSATHTGLASVVWQMDDDEVCGMRPLPQEANARLIAAANPTVVEALISDLRSARALLAEAGEVLRPFATAHIGPEWKDYEGQGDLDRFRLTVGDLRTARALAERIEKEIGND